jgi:hypothetical protein
MSEENVATTDGRTVGDRIAVRWPGLARLTAASVLRLPRDSRLKRTLLERTAHAAYEAWNRDDLVLARGAADPEIQVHFQHAADSPLAG